MKSGTKWTTERTAHLSDGDAVSCISADSCWAVTALGDAVHYDGHVWAKPVVVDPHSVGAGGLQDVSCASAHYCVAVNRKYEHGDYYIYDGHNWSPGHKTFAGSLTSVSCPSRSLCLAVNGVDSGVDIHDGGDRGSFVVDATQPGPNGQLQASCPTAKFCAVLDGNSAVGFSR